MSSDLGLIEKWVRQRGAQAVSMVSVKEFMTTGLDDSIVVQGKLKKELQKFFDLIKTTPGYAEADKLADEGGVGNSNQLTKSGT